MITQIKRLFHLIDIYGISSNNYPNYIENDYQTGIQFKRCGEYEKSLTIINELIENVQRAYTGLLNGAFKTIAASGYLYEAKKLLIMCDKVMQNNENAMMLAQMGIPNNFADHLYRLSNALSDEFLLKQYLMSISGNINYSFPRDYSIMKSEYYK